MMRTSRGRMVTRNAWLHFGMEAPRRSAEPDLFEGGTDRPS
jgi:Holliday junction DNA helicase RuvB